jgi:hypothetical protein
LPECVRIWWTSRRPGAILAPTHRGGLQIVPVWDLFSDQDKPLKWSCVILGRFGAASTIGSIGVGRID